MNQWLWGGVDRKNVVKQASCLLPPKHFWVKLSTFASVTLYVRSMTSLFNSPPGHIKPWPCSLRSSEGGKKNVKNLEQDLLHLAQLCQREICTICDCNMAHSGLYYTIIEYMRLLSNLLKTAVHAGNIISGESKNQCHLPLDLEVP